MRDETAMTYTTLVSADLLKQHLDDPNWIILDVRHDLFNSTAGVEAYRAGHIPGARFAALDDDLSGPKNGRNGRHPLPDREALAERFRAWGIGHATQIVAYDAQGGQFAARLWWLARWLGHRATALLDGGWPAWIAAGGAADASVPAAARGGFTATASLAPSLDANDVLANLTRGERIVVDARSPERYRGEQEPLDPVAGHIPGAVNRPCVQNLGPDQRFKTSAELRAEFASLLGDRAPALVVHQCGSGVTACHNLLAMEIAGLTGSALFAGSWSEWVADPARPVRTGAAP
jgi:thiosulfate/3-mercaptopyruvate sulfurtransferase